MPQKIPDTNVLSWAFDLDEKGLGQARTSASLPFIKSHVALMPDAHFGYGAMVGSVIPTEGAIIPYAVGVDIGCGMIAAQTTMTASDLPDSLDELHDEFVEAVPTGFGRHTDDHAMFDEYEKVGPNFTVEDDTKLSRTAITQMGSLGGGNHFIEVCLDQDDAVWVVLHSGSRGVGNKLATMHVERAKGLMKAYFIELEDPNLAYLVEGTAEFDAYIRDMRWAQDYAMQNRRTMMDIVITSMNAVLGEDWGVTEVINCHHNYTEREHHMGRNMWITRKGAIRARAGDRGVIPGSMGAATFITTGLGNKASYCSSSHGAGRVLGRKAAEKILSADSLVEAMGDRSWNVEQASQLVDEHPAAYKRIEDVMAAQADLTQVTHQLRQILNVKGAK